MNITHLGLVAGTITTAAGFPQLVRAYRTRQTRDISIWQPVLLTIGMTLWLLYGIALGDSPLIVANAVSIFCYGTLIILKIRFKKDDK